MENQDKINLIKQMIDAAQVSIDQAKELLAQMEDKGDDSSEDSENPKIQKPTFFSIPQIGKVIEGTFNGENMIDSEGREYSVPANYASKSKLVEGDILKLTIVSNGSFIYKQIGPVARKRLVGRLIQDETGQHFVLAGRRSYKVLLASVTYFKAKNGDELTILVSKEKETQWAAIENIVPALEKQKRGKIEEREVSVEEPKPKESEKDSAKLIKDEWTPDLDEIKKEASDDFSEESEEKFNL